MTRRDELEESLGGLTSWRGATGELWKKALENASQSPPPPALTLRRFLAKPLASPALAAMVALIFVSVVGFAMLPTLGGATSAARRVANSPPAAAASNEQLARAVQGVTADYSATPEPTSRPAPEPTADRHIVRKATIELETPDVHAAFAKAMHIVSPARGEYVQDSSITGEDRRARATLTLRIAADRLNLALAELREFGSVRHESTSGEDVTAQVVDIEARLRNEQRVETELLQLLEGRAGAPLKEILELRDSISGVRQNIERMQGQRQHLARLTSLATVLVIIRTADQPHVAGGSITEYFLNNVLAAWNSGLRLLADTAAFLVRILVGGLFFWILLIFAILAAVRWNRRALARGV